MTRRRFVAAPEYTAAPREVFIEREFGMEPTHEALGVTRIHVGECYARVSVEWAYRKHPELYITRTNPNGGAAGVSFNLDDLAGVRELGTTLLQLVAVAEAEIARAEGATP